MSFFPMLIMMLNVATSVSTSENPIRRIVNLLQQMQTEIEQEGAKDEELMEKYHCYCQKNDAKLASSVQNNEEKQPTVEADIEAATSKKTQLDADLAEQKSTRSTAQETIDTATSQRTKERQEAEAEMAELKANGDSCISGVEALKKGLGEAFVQSGAGRQLSRFVSGLSVSAESRGEASEAIDAFLQSGTAGSGEVVGIMSQMAEDMAKDLQETKAAEAEAQGNFESLIAAKKKEIAAATAAIEAKTGEAGETAVEIESLKAELRDTVQALTDDRQFLLDLRKGCEAEAKNSEIRKSNRADEIMAIGETTKILNDDDALDLFKKTLPSPGGTSLLQIVGDSTELTDEAQEELSVTRRPEAALISAALKSGKGFGDVMGMIDTLTKTLKSEQKDDDQLKSWCEKELDQAEEDAKDQARFVKLTSTKREEVLEGIEALKQGVATLVQGIKSLDVAVTEGTTQRKEEHDVFSNTQAENNAALQLLGVAKNRLAKFYNPALYKAPAERELTDAERTYVQSGGVLTTAAPGGIANTGIATLVQVRVAELVAPPPPPATAEAYKKKDGGGPMGLIDMLAQDIKKEMQEAQHDEEVAQRDYEKFCQDSGKKRKADAMAVTEKEGQKAGLEETAEQLHKELKGGEKEVQRTKEFTSELHGTCDFLLENYDTRKEARANEVEGLSKAKATLSGADYSFLQTGFLARHF